jgi:hypothetical protein
LGAPGPIRVPRPAQTISAVTFMSSLILRLV